MQVTFKFNSNYALQRAHIAFSLHLETIKALL